MWLTAVYHQVSLFSLKPSDATSTGGRSLLLPTPFSIKMALLDVALRLYGERGVHDAHLFPLIRDLGIAISLPPQIVVNNCFVRIHKPRRPKSGKGEKEGDGDEQSGSGNDGPFIHSVAFREYVQYNGPLGIALEMEDQRDTDTLALLLMQITYFGKRGSLFQIDSLPRVVEKLPIRQGYNQINKQPVDGEHNPRSILQMLDDCDSKLTFAKASIYSAEQLSPRKDRVFISVRLPYQPTRSSRSFTLYERIKP
ncbi:MAG: hypothetical protein MI924_33800 [Chloroflexales bacterium]|nr:hypothetical protein [Chloroflexales bacterium]